MTNFVTSLSILRGHFDHSTSQAVMHVLSTLLTNLHDQSVHVMGQFINNSVTHNACTTMHMHRHCGLHQLCVALQYRVTFCRWLRYFDWSRWLSALGFELRQPGISIGAESVPGTGYFARVGSESRLWVFEDLGYLKNSVPEPTVAGTRFFRRVELQF